MDRTNKHTPEHCFRAFARTVFSVVYFAALTYCERTRQVVTGVKCKIAQQAICPERKSFLAQDRAQNPQRVIPGHPPGREQGSLENARAFANGCKKKRAKLDQMGRLRLQALRAHPPWSGGARLFAQDPQQQRLVDLETGLARDSERDSAPNWQPCCFPEL